MTRKTVFFDWPQTLSMSLWSGYGTEHGQAVRSASGTQLLLEIAQERLVEPILKEIVEHGSERSEYVFTQVWLVEKGDLCATRKYRSECPD